jgi:PAS domain S-box-containing protein
MSGGSILTLAPSFLAFACFTLPTATPLVIALLLDNEKIFNQAGLMGVVFLVAVHVLARGINLFNKALLQSNRSLNVTAQELARHKNRLEKLVEDRTGKLKESKENYRRLTEEINDAIFELENNCIISYISPVIELILGHQPEKLIGTPFMQLVCSEDQLMRDKLFPEALSGTIEPVDCRFRDNAGELHWVRVSSRPVLDGNRVVGFRGALADIEKEVQAKIEKTKLLQRFYENQKLESVATLAGGVAHDFNNLLMVIQGHASLMAAKIDISDPNLKHIRVIEDQIGKAKGLTSQLLGIAKGGKYDPKPIDLNELIGHSAMMFERAKKDIRIHMNMPQSPVVVEVDRQQIEQVMLNIFINAWEAMPRGGTLQVESLVLTLDELYCNSFHVVPGRFVKLSVTDTGIGMDEYIRERVFDPFFTTKKKSWATGLGLASAYGIIRNHGGFITIHSQLGEGTTLDIFLPVSNKILKEAILEEPEVAEGSETILLVDDDEQIINVCRALLEKLGYTVIAAFNGEEAMDCIQKKGKEVDLVILDMIMPGMDGGMTFDKLRELYPSMPVILSSGYSIDGQAKQIMERGCNGFLQKPFSMAELSQKIRLILER